MVLKRYIIKMCKGKETFLKMLISSFSSNLAKHYMREYGQLIQTIKKNYKNQAGMVVETYSAVPIHEDRVSCREKSLNVL